MATRSYNHRMSRNSLHSVILAAFLLLPFLMTASALGGTSRRFSILFVGDILLANEAEQHIHKKGIEYPFWKIKQELLKYDFIFANMESPITTRGVPVTDKPYVFRVKPGDAACLRDLKIDAVSIANNHLMDFNLEGMEDTIDTLDSLNIRHTGGGWNLAEARRPAILTYATTNIVILAYCNRPPEDYYATDSKPGIARLDLGMIREDIESYKLSNNIVVVSLHWGIEQTHVPQSSQVREAHAIIDAGADAVIGHHPHWPQGIEIYRGKPIVYSLGNFINGYINPIERDNIAVALYYNGNALELVKVVPLAGRNRQIKFQPHVLEGKPAADFLQLIRGLSLKFNTDITVANGVGLIDMTGNAAPAGGKARRPALPRPVPGIFLPDLPSPPPLKTGNK